MVIAMEYKTKETHWIDCPICKGKTRVKVYKDTVLIHFPLFCPRCKRVTEVNVAKLKMEIVESEM